MSNGIPFYYHMESFKGQWRRPTLEDTPPPPPMWREIPLPGNLRKGYREPEPDEQPEPLPYIMESGTANTGRPEVQYWDPPPIGD